MISIAHLTKRSSADVLPGYPSDVTRDPRFFVAEDKTAAGVPPFHDRKKGKFHSKMYKVCNDKRRAQTPPPTAVSGRRGRGEVGGSHTLSHAHCKHHRGDEIRREQQPAHRNE